MRIISVFNLSWLVLGVVFCFSNLAQAQTSAFTYQGKLTDLSAPANGVYDFTFRLYDGSGQIGTDAVVDDVTVTNGIFTVILDFGAPAFSGGGPRSIEIGVRPGASTGEFTFLTPRQELTSAPFAIKTLNAASADALSASCALCLSDAQIQSIDGSKVTGTVANAATANSVSGVVPIANGGTGSSTKNFVDLSTNQNIIGNKTFSQTASFTGASITSLTSSGSATFNGSVAFNNADPISVSGTMNVGGSVNADQLSASELSISGILSGNVVNTQTNFNVGGTRVLQATDEYLLLGRDITVGPGLTRATAIGNGTQVHRSDSIVLGTTPSFGGFSIPNTFVGVGVSSPSTKLDVGGQVLIRNGIANSIIGGGLRGLLNVVQTGSGDANFYMQGAGGGRGINFAATALNLGSDARLIISHYDGTTYQNRFTLSPLGDVGIGTITPMAKLDVAGTVRVGTIGIAGVTAVCFDASLVLSACSSSGRYKTKINSFTSGLDLVRRLQPVSFNWKADNKADMGLIAEEVAEVDAGLVTHNDKGEVEGVKYDRIGVVLINAVKEQQAQIEEHQKLIEQQQKQIDALKKLVCSQNTTAEICKQQEK